MRLNKRGVALLQVLIISAILAGLSTMILRATLSRTVMARQTKSTISAQMVIESCMAEVNAWWASKTPEQYAADLAECTMCSITDKDSCSDGDGNRQQWTCTDIPGPDNKTYSVKADMSSGDSNSPCKIEYTIEDGVGNL